MILKKPTSLYLCTLEDGYYVAVNTLHPRSLRIITEAQAAFIDRTTGYLAVEQIARQQGIDAAQLETLARRFVDCGFLETPGARPPAIKGDEPTGLDLWIHTSNRCNLTCGYCYIATVHRKDRMSDLNRSALFDGLLFTAKERKLHYIKLRLAGGEPLLQFHEWHAFLEHLSSALQAIGCSLQISFLTNLTILNEDILAFSRRHDVSFSVSLDGLSQAHDLSRRTHAGMGTFYTVLANIEQLRNHNIRFNINTVITNNSVRDIPELTELLIKEGFVFRYSLVKGDVIDRTLLFSSMHASYALMLEAAKTGWQFSVNHRLSDLKPMELGFQTCGAGHSTAAIGVDGGVYFCQVQFGNTKLELAQLASSPNDLLGAINAAPQYHSERSSDCASCNYRFACNSGCPMYRVDGKDPYCGFYHEFLPIIYQICGHERLFALKAATRQRRPAVLR